MTLNETMKTIVYFHGYGSSCQSNSAACLANNMPEFNVIAPDIPVDPKEALPFLKSYCAKNKVDLIIGQHGGHVCHADDGLSPHLR
jgi:predicted esterase YcpF (UPF0227 family)